MTKLIAGAHKPAWVIGRDRTKIAVGRYRMTMPEGYSFTIDARRTANRVVEVDITEETEISSGQPIVVRQIS